MAGGRLDDITAACEETVIESANNIVFVIHIGTVQMSKISGVRNDGKVQTEDTTVQN